MVVDKLNVKLKNFILIILTILCSLFIIDHLPYNPLTNQPSYIIVVERVKYKFFYPTTNTNISFMDKTVIQDQSVNMLIDSRIPENISIYEKYSNDTITELFRYSNISRFLYVFNINVTSDYYLCEEWGYEMSPGKYYQPIYHIYCKLYSPLK